MEILEEKLIEAAKPYFVTARAGDWEHALRVVKWVKELGAGRSDLGLLVAAAYIHDIGWSGIAPQGKLDLEEMLKLESSANENSNNLINEVLGKLKYSETDIDTVKRLVRAADRHESQEGGEAVIVDSDSLSKLCAEHLQEKYQPESFSDVIKLWETALPQRLKTEQAKILFPKLLANLKERLT